MRSGLRVGVTGSNSKIGKLLVLECESRGMEVVEFLRAPDPTRPNNSHFDLSSPINMENSHLDAFIHLAWDWVQIEEESYRRNITNLIPALDYLSKHGVKLVLLSSESANPESNSIYGRTKHLLEGEFENRGGTNVRAGLVWGREPFGILKSIKTISELPVFCAHLIPDPNLTVSNVDELVSRLAEVAVSKGLSHTESFVSNHGANLSSILHIFGSRGLASKIHIKVPIKLVIWLGTIASAIRIPLPFRVDSLRSFSQIQNIGFDDKKIVRFTESKFSDFENWAKK